jgi:[acyl-carrier-protein] S-malonyltransferase
VVVMSVAAYRVMRSELRLRPHFALGHSLGEYAALCCAGALSLRATLEIVSRREALIRAAALDGSMMWVINLKRTRIEEICRSASTPESPVFVSAYDHATQHSISGRTAAVTIAARQAESAGATVFPLRGSGPWHCPLMAGVTAQLRGVLHEYDFQPPQFPVIANLTSQPYPSSRIEMMDLLAGQLENPLLLAESLRWAESQGVSAAVSLGPKDVMKFLAEKNSSRLRAFTMERAEQVEQLREALILDPKDLNSVAVNCVRCINTTPNYNYDAADYLHSVVEPYRRLETAYFQRMDSGESFPLSEVSLMAGCAVEILRAKRLPQDAILDGVSRIWLGKFPAGPSSEGSRDV